MTVEPVVKPSARMSRVEMVVGQIQSMIERRDLCAGVRLPSEQQWAAKLNVSRPAVREAVGRLRSLGLVEVVRGRSGGLFVGDHDAATGGAKLLRSALALGPKDVRQFAELRAVLESHTVRRLAETATPEQLVALERLCDEIDLPGMTDEEMVEADLRFHLAMAELAGNEAIRQTLQVVREIVAAGVRRNRRSPKNYRLDSRRLHRRIVDALRSRDPIIAQQAILEHLDVDIEPARRRSPRQSPKKNSKKA